MKKLYDILNVLFHSLKIMNINPLRIQVYIGRIFHQAEVLSRALPPRLCNYFCMQLCMCVPALKVLLLHWIFSPQKYLQVVRQWVSYWINPPFSKGIKSHLVPEKFLNYKYLGTVCSVPLVSIVLVQCHTVL